MDQVTPINIILPKETITEPPPRINVAMRFLSLMYETFELEDVADEPAFDDEISRVLLGTEFPVMSKYEREVKEACLTTILQYVSEPHDNLGKIQLEFLKPE